jgi:hypothetical protein
MPLVTLYEPDIVRPIHEVRELLGNQSGRWGGIAMLGYLLGAGLKGAVVVAAVVLVALLRCRREDIPAVIRELGPWWRRK